VNDEIRAAVGAHQELGPSYNEAVAEGLVERIGAEIDRRIDTRLGRADGAGTAGPPPAQPAATTLAPRRPATSPWVTPFVAFGSIGLGLAATGILTSKNGDQSANIAVLIVIWLVIMIVNVVYARHKN
jgi:hypothetical protein